MEIISIKNLINKVENFENKTEKTEDYQNAKSMPKDTLTLTDWQKSVVDIALKYLENKKQVENNHPLSQARFKQIQTFEEALKELDELRKEKFKEEGLKAQANINPESVVSLFIQ